MFSTSSSISWPPVYNTNDSNTSDGNSNIHSALQLSTSNSQSVGSTASLSLPDHNVQADMIWNNAVPSHQEYNHPVVTQTIASQSTSAAGLSPTDVNFTTPNITPSLSSNIPLHLHNANTNSAYSWSSAHPTSNDMYNCSMSSSSSSLASETSDTMNTNFLIRIFIPNFLLMIWLLSNFRFPNICRSWHSQFRCTFSSSYRCNSFSFMKLLCICHSLRWVIKERLVILLPHFINLEDRRLRS